MEDYDLVKQYLNDPERQDVIDKPQVADPTKPHWLPKHLLKDASGKTIGYWKGDMHYYENGKIAGFYPPVFLPPISHVCSWKFDTVSGKFYII